MADKNISGLTAGSVPLAGTEKIHVVQGANSRQVTVQDVAVMGSPIKTVTTTTYTLLAADRGKWIRFTNAGAVTVTVDDAVHSIADEITIEQAGAGGITVAGGVGFTLNSRGDLFSTGGLHAVASLKFSAVNAATLVGDLA